MQSELRKILRRNGLNEYGKLIRVVGKVEKDEIQPIESWGQKGFASSFQVYLKVMPKYSKDENTKILLDMEGFETRKFGKTEDKAKKETAEQVAQDVYEMIKDQFMEADFKKMFEWLKIFETKQVPEILKETDGLMEDKMGSLMIE